MTTYEEVLVHRLASREFSYDVCDTAFSWNILASRVLMRHISSI